MGQRMKVGVVGCGAFCSGTHIPNLARNPGFELVAFCDLDAKRLAALAETYRARFVTDDAEKVFADPAIAMVVCGTKPDARLPLMRLAVKYGKPLFVEKPLCYREDEVDEMVSLMRRSAGPFMVGFNRPYSPMMQAIKPAFQRRREGNTLILYRIIGEGALWPESHKQAILVRKESTIVHEVTHIFDLLNWMTDRAPSRVYTAGGGNVDNIITLSYPDAITAVIVAGDNATAGFPKERIEIDTNGGTIVGDEFVEMRVVGFDETAWGRQFEFSQGGETCRGGIAEAAARAAAWRQSVTPEERQYGYYYDRMVRVNKGHYEELEHFRQSIEAGRPPDTDVIKGAMANLMAWRAVESWQRGAPVDLNFAYLNKL